MLKFVMAKLFHQILGDKSADQVLIFEACRAEMRVVERQVFDTRVGQVAHQTGLPDTLGQP